jgi:L-cysteate sulfo-lyase
MIERPFRLATLPTPLHPLERLSMLLGQDVWIKRDDLTGYAMGGNKVRKAEFLLADALAQESDVVLTAGAVQSNHARVIASVARRFGMECCLYLSGQAPDSPTGNLLLDRLAGARIQFVPTSAERNAVMEKDAERLRQAGRRPYVIPIGGSNAIGSIGYAAFFEELVEQLEALPPKPTILLFPTSSGGTYAGILVGKALMRSSVELLGVRVDLDPNPEQVICEVANALAERLGILGRFTPADVPMNAEFVGGGYGLPTDAAQEAMRLLWQEEGVLLDPVYTGKAMSGLLALARQGALSDRRVIFLHTGGAPGVFR